MSDKPILFSPSMVRALLDGRKTMTRRILKNRGALPEYRGPRGCEDDPECWGWEDGETGYHIGVVPAADRSYDLHWMGGHAPGDRLYVREAWRTPAVLDKWSPSEIERQCVEEAGYRKPWAPLAYEADGTRLHHDQWESEPGRLRAGMHMPRWASRLTLIVTEVRVERVQEISEEDAEAEGARAAFRNPATDIVSMAPRYRWGFHELWDSINGPRGFGWDVNPWVSVTSFSVIKQNIDQVKP